MDKISGTVHLAKFNSLNTVAAVSLADIGRPARDKRPSKSV